MQQIAEKDFSSVDIESMATKREAFSDPPLSKTPKINP
jgi:hypothetical protein